MNSWRMIRHTENKIREQRDWREPLLCPSWDYCQVTVLISCNIWSPQHTSCHGTHMQMPTAGSEESCGPLPKDIGLRCQGSAEIRRSWSQKPSKGQHLTAEPGSWSCSLSITWAIPCQKMSHGGSTPSSEITGIWHLSRTLFLIKIKILAIEFQFSHLKI